MKPIIAAILILLGFSLGLILLAMGEPVYGGFSVVAGFGAAFMVSK